MKGERLLQLASKGGIDGEWHVADAVVVDDGGIGAVARECGFTDRSYFQRKFKELTDRTPAEWRAQ